MNSEIFKINKYCSFLSKLELKKIPKVTFREKPELKRETQ